MSLRNERPPNRQSLAGLCSAVVHGFRRGYRAWDALPVRLIDGIVIKLRETHRWRRDGPVLRLLNKHWSSQMDKNIQEIRPHADIKLHTSSELAYVSRKLTEADTASLLKFVNLITLDLMSFLVSYESFVPERGQLNRQAIRVIQKQKEDLERVFRILSKLPRLRHVDVSESVLKFQLRFCWRGGLIQWKRLSTVSSLRFYKPFERITASDESQTVQPYQQAHGLVDWEVEGLCGLIEELPCVTALEFTAKAEQTPACITKLERLEQLKLNVSVQSRFLEDLSNWLPHQALLAVNVTTTCTRSDAFKSLRNLEKLPQLQSLTFWYVADCRPLMHRSLSRTLQNLTTLQLEGAAPFVKIPIDFFGRPLPLKHLSLANFEFDGHDLLGNLRDLTTLSLTSCRIRGGAESLRQLEKLEEFYSIGTFLEEAAGDYIEVKPQNLVLLRSQIKRLGLTNILSDDMIFDLVNLPNLEYLSIGTTQNVSAQSIAELGRLPSLRYLRVSHSNGNEMLASFFSLGFLTNLERLSYDVTFAATERLESYAQKLKKKAPHLKIH